MANLQCFRCALRNLAAAAGILLLAAPPAMAVTATTTFQVTATVLKACVMTTPATLAFGTYTPSSATPLTGSTSFTVICTFNTTYSLGLSPSPSAGTVTNRRMTSAGSPAGSNLLFYGLYKDAGLLTNWDNSVSAAGYTGNGLIQSYTVYGSVPAGQYTAAPATDYLDTITLTLTY